MKKVSVIVPVYNGGRSLRNCLASIFDTDFQRFEVVVVDDGSKDDSISIAREFPCRVLAMGANKGPSLARNMGVANSDGDLLLFTDSDCLVEKDWVKKMHDEFYRINENGGQIMAMGGRVLPNKSFVSKCVAYAGYYAFQHGDKIIDRPDLCSADLLVSRKAFDEVGGFDETLINGEDNDLTCRVCVRGYRSVYNPFVSVVHDHDKSMIGFFRHQEYWGRWHGLKLEVKYQKMRNIKSFLFIRNPILYLLLLAVPISLAITWRSVHANLKYDAKVLIYAPFIFISKIFYRWGVVQWLFKEGKTYDFAS